MGDREIVILFLNSDTGQPFVQRLDSPETGQPFV